MNFQISKWPYPQEIRAEFLSAYFFGSCLRVTRLMLVICDMWHGTSHKILAPTCADNFKFINSAFTSKCYTLTLKCSRLMVSRPYLNKDTWHHTISDEHDFWHNSSLRFLTELTNLHLRPNNHGNNNNNNYVLSHFSKSEALYRLSRSGLLSWRCLVCGNETPITCLSPYLSASLNLSLEFRADLNPVWPYP